MKALILLLSALAAHAQVLTLAASNVTPTSATIQVVFNAGATPVAGLNLTLPSNAANETIAPTLNKLFRCNPAKLCYVLALDNNAAIPSGVIASFTVQQSGAYQLTSVVASSPLGVAVPVTIGPAITVTLPPATVSRCEFTGDSSITSADADRLLSYVLGTVAPPAGAVLDVDRSGSANVVDVMRVVLAALGTVACPL